MDSFGKKMGRGAVWIVAARVTEQALGLLSTLVLARLLVPSDFGLVAMATAVIAFLELFTAFGFDMALIQNQQAQRSHYDTVWTFKVLFGATVAVALLALAAPAAEFYNEPRLGLVVALLAAAPLIHGFENVGTVDFRKHFLFHKEFQFILGSKATAVVTGVAMAGALGSYWALVAGILAGKLAGLALSYRLHPYRPRLSLAARGELFHVSKWLLINNLVSFLVLRAPDIVIGRLIGARSLGLYNMSYTVACLPTTNLSAPINRAVFPGYAAMSSDLALLRRSFVNVVSMIAFVTFPAAAGIAVTAELAVEFLLGGQWIEAVPILQVLTFYTAISTITSHTFYVLMALGCVNIYTSIMGGAMVVYLPLLVALVQRFGAIGAAWAHIIVALALLPVLYGVTLRKLELKASVVIGALWRPVVGAAIMVVVVGWIEVSLAMGWGANPAAAELLLAVGVGVVSYASFVLLMWNVAGRPVGAERLILDKMTTLTRRIGRTA